MSTEKHVVLRTREDPHVQTVRVATLSTAQLQFQQNVTFRAYQEQRRRNLEGYIKKWTDQFGGVHHYVEDRTPPGLGPFHLSTRSAGYTILLAFDSDSLKTRFISDLQREFPHVRVEAALKNTTWTSKRFAIQLAMPFETAESTTLVSAQVGMMLGLVWTFCVMLYLLRQERYSYLGFLSPF